MSSLPATTTTDAARVSVSPSATKATLADARDVAAIARGDRRALGALYDRYASKMLALGVHLIKQHREAEDILHDVFVEVWKRAGDYDPRRGTVKTWLYLRMRSRCLDRVRSAGYARGESLGDREEWLLNPPARAAEQVAAMELAPDATRLRAALLDLSEEHRQVLALAYFRGLSSSEIADALAIPIGTVKSRVRAALIRLRAAMGAAA